MPIHDLLFYLIKISICFCFRSLFVFLDLSIFTLASILEDGQQAPIFVQEPVSRLIFSNDSGSQISCSAHGVPTPIVTWIKKDNSIVTPVPGLR